MNIYAEIGSNFQQIGGECPDGFIVMHAPRPDDKDSTEYTAQANGTWAITQETVDAKLAPIENEWRDQQMPIARNNVTAIQFGDEGVPGTEQQWKDYWLALRKWTTDNPDFPDSTKRPVAPNA